MLTKEKALTAETFHRGTCCRQTGPHGGVTVRREVWRRNGATKTWKTRPEEWEVPVKHRLAQHARLTHRHAAEFHAAEDCPLLVQETAHA